MALVALRRFRCPFQFRQARFDILQFNSLDGVSDNEL
jgi:hypothetical protein